MLCGINCLSMFHLLFILKNQPCTKIHVLFPRRSKCLLNNFRINHIFPNICIKWWGRRFINRGRICNMLNSNSSICIMFITFSHIINMRIGINFMVINTPVKVTLLNPLFVLISIIKIFTNNGIMINTIFVFIFNDWKCRGFTLMCTKLIFLSIARFNLNCCWCLLKMGCIASQCGASII